MGLVGYLAFLLGCAGVACAMFMFSGAWNQAQLKHRRETIAKAKALLRESEPDPGDFGC